MNSCRVLLIGLVAMAIVALAPASGKETAPVLIHPMMISNVEIDRESKEYAIALSKWQEAIARFVAEDETVTPMSEGILFTGSSTARLWKVEKWFPERVALNRGFGGSQFTDLIYFAPEIIGHHQPEALVIYSGDNDIHAGKSFTEVARNSVVAIDRFRQVLSPDTKIILLAIKPSQSRWHLYPEMCKANLIMETLVYNMHNVIFLDLNSLLLNESGLPAEECYLDDNLHLSEEGYRRWSEALEEVLSHHLPLN